MRRLPLLALAFCCAIALWAVGFTPDVQARSARFGCSGAAASCSAPVGAGIVSSIASNIAERRANRAGRRAGRRNRRAAVAAAYGCAGDVGCSAPAIEYAEPVGCSGY